MYSVSTDTGVTSDTETATALPDRQCEPVARTRQGVVAGRTRDIEVAAQDLVEKELRAQRDLCRILRAVIDVIGIANRLWQCANPGGGLRNRHRERYDDERAANNFSPHDERPP